jgi:protein-S-isoprenylcysteine O-methyltransferase Ste14
LRFLLSTVRALFAYRWIEVLAWLACVVYSTIPSFWLMIHPRIGFWRARLRSPYRVLLPIWLTMWVALGGASWQWRKVALYSSRLHWIPAVALLALSMYLYRASKTGFTAAQLGGRPELQPGEWEQRLATGGIRSHIRHPVYLAHLCEMLAWSLGSGLAVCFALTAFAIVTGAFMLRVEDRELEQRFGEAYRDYRRRVPALLPKL